MKIVYLLLVYKNPQQVLHLVHRLQGPDVSFFVHIDAASKEDFSGLDNIENLRFASNPRVTEWGSVNAAFAILDCLKEISKISSADRVILMSESDYPVKPNEYISRYLASDSRDFITIRPLPHPNPLCSPGGFWLEGGRRRYECYALKVAGNSIVTIEPRKLNVGNLRQFAKLLRYNPEKLSVALKIFLKYPKRRHPADLIPCGGDTWFILTMKTVKRIVDFCDRRPDYLDYAVNTQNLDELFIQTIVNHVVPPKDRRNTTLRYINWQNNGASSPGNFTLADSKLLHKCIADPDILFVRKVQDIDVCRMIDISIES